MKKVILATSSVVLVMALMMILSNPAMAEAEVGSVPQMGHQFKRAAEKLVKKHPSRVIDSLALKLGLNAADMKQELNAGKTMKQVLEEHNITADQVRGLLPGKSHVTKFKVLKVKK